MCEELSNKFVPHFPGCDQSRVWCVVSLTRAAAGLQLCGGAGRWRALRGSHGREKPWKTGSENAVPEPLLALQCCVCTATSALSGPVSALHGWKWAYTRELWNFLVVVTETSRVHLSINTAPISVYITHSTSSLAD